MGPNVFSHCSARAGSRSLAAPRLANVVDLRRRRRAAHCLRSAVEPPSSEFTLKSSHERLCSSQRLSLSYSTGPHSYDTATNLRTCTALILYGNDQASSVALRLRNSAIQSSPYAYRLYWLPLLRPLTLSPRPRHGPTFYRLPTGAIARYPRGRAMWPER